MRSKGACWTGIIFTREKEEEERAKHCLSFRAFLEKEVSTFSSPFLKYIMAQLSVPTYPAKQYAPNP